MAVWVEIETEKLNIDPSWRAHVSEEKTEGGAAFIVPHSDDAEFIGWGIIQEMVKADIPVTVILLTMGEKGKPPDSIKTEEQVIEERKSEAESSANALGMHVIYVNSPAPDGDVEGYEEDLKHQVMDITRLKKFDVIFSWDEYDRTRGLNHPDHNASGRIAKSISFAARTRGSKYDTPGIEPLSYRPRLFAWTSDRTAAPEPIYIFQFNETAMAAREDHFDKYYPTQMPKSKIETEYRPLFQRANKGIASQYEQKYVELR
ncbi:PIG-L family deacetylase [Candidatus Gottesmanbacteria bacterium]|nr:PIG-L family deacetylase [Candidatus Gottesmanbacteria bacterium]